MIKKTHTTFFEPADFDDDSDDDTKFSKMATFSNVVSMLVLLLEDLPNLIIFHTVIRSADKFCGKHHLRQFKTTSGRTSQMSSLVASTANALWNFIVYSFQMFVTKGLPCFRRYCCCGNKRYTFETSRQVLTSIGTTRLTPCCSLLFVYC